MANSQSWLIHLILCHPLSWATMGLSNVHIICYYRIEEIVDASFDCLVYLSIDSPNWKSLNCSYIWFFTQITCTDCFVFKQQIIYTNIQTSHLQKRWWQYQNVCHSLCEGFVISRATNHTLTITFNCLNLCIIHTLMSCEESGSR